MAEGYNEPTSRSQDGGDQQEERDDNPYTLGGETAEEVYNRLASGKREAVNDMGRKMAELTIPSVFPPEEYEPGDDLPGNNQSVGAQCVNTLAAHLEFMAFPPGQPIMRLQPVEYAIQAQVDQDPELWARVQLGMSRLELAHRNRLSTTQIATAYTGYIKLLLVAGNALWKQVSLEEPTYHRPDCYVVKRNAAGLPLLSIHKERMSLQEMDEDHVEFLETVADDDLTRDWENKSEWEKEVDIYSVCKLKVGKDNEWTWFFWQEYKGHALPDTEVETDFVDAPMWPGWLIPVYGKDWGRGYCEEYRGDLYTMEAHASAVNDGASLAALSLLFVKPGSTTSIKQIREARNLSTLPGDAESDLSVFRTDKTGDFNFVMTNLERIERRLSAAFLLQVAVVRQAERVTKEEIQRVGQELDKALGGLYTQIAQANQKQIISRAVYLHEEEAGDALPEIPRDIVSIQVITGLDGLGQSLEYDALKEYAADGIAAFPQQFEEWHNASDFFTRMASAKGIKPDGLVKKPEVVAQERQQKQQQAVSASLIDKGTGPAVKGLADAAMASQQQPGYSPQQGEPA